MEQLTIFSATLLLDDLDGEVQSMKGPEQAGHVFVAGLFVSYEPDVGPILRSAEQLESRLEFLRPVQFPIQSKPAVGEKSNRDRVLFFNDHFPCGLTGGSIPVATSVVA